MCSGIDNLDDVLKAFDNLEVMTTLDTAYYHSGIVNDPTRSLMGKIEASSTDGVLKANGVGTVVPITADDMNPAASGGTISIKIKDTLIEMNTEAGESGDGGPPAAAADARVPDLQGGGHHEAGADATGHAHACPGTG